MKITANTLLFFFLLTLLPLGAALKSINNIPLLPEQECTRRPLPDPFFKKVSPAKGVQEIAEWTFIILVQASNNLESFAHKNMKEMMRWGSSKDLNILVDLHKSGDKSWRYKIEQGACSAEKVSTRRANATIEEEVLETAEWAITNFPARKYALIFWNHGYGCIDPQMNGNQPAYVLKTFSRATRNSVPVDRSILFDDERNIYLSNQGLRSTLATISTRFLEGKKIDLVGMDACLMGMIEIADQIKEYAEYFVASEEFEFAHGWPYGAIIEKLRNEPLSAEELGKHIVTCYEEYYLNRTSYFTQSCINLSKIDALKTNVDLLAQALIVAKKQDPERMKLFIQQARCQTLSFSLSDYVDINSLYQELLKISRYALDYPLNKAIPVPRISTELLRTIQLLTTEGIELLRECVVANTAGRYLFRAKGLSLYFPQKVVDPSYVLTEFSKTTQWGDFIALQTA